LIKFNSAGVRQWGTYYGGTVGSNGFACVVDNNGNVFMTGITRDTTPLVIATAGAHQTIYGQGLFDAYVVKFSDCISYDSISPIACGSYMSPAGNNYTASGIYMDTLVAANTNGCDSVITINLTVDSIANNNTQILNECEGFSITVGANIYDTTGIYLDIIGCDTTITDLTINPLPIITITQMDDSCGESVGSISASVMPIAMSNSYVWDNGEIDSSISNLAEGSYTLIVFDTIGCSDTQQVVVNNSLANCEQFLYVPNAFSPNGDGVNEFFTIRGLTNYEIFNMKIYNRWGVKVFETEGSTPGWDGTQHGKKSPTGVYVYYIDVEFANNITPFVTKGNVTLIR